jgi:hypothetical protein
MWSPAGRPGGFAERDSAMADLAYVALTIVAFVLLAVMVRGLEKLR